MRLALVVSLVVTLLHQRARGAPPLDQLGLRDALLARPEVIAALPPQAQQRLAERFESARQRTEGTVRLPGVNEALGVDLVRVLDGLRLAERKDALLISQFVLLPVGLEAQPLETPVDPSRTLPPLEGVPAGVTAEAEASALQGAAGALLGALLRQAEATHLVRVVSWPVAAVAIHNVVYVNAAWLVALSPTPTGGAPDPAPTPAGQATETGCGGSVGGAAPAPGPTASPPPPVAAVAPSEPPAGEPPAARAPISELPIRGSDGPPAAAASAQAGPTGLASPPSPAPLAVAGATGAPPLQGLWNGRGGATTHGAGSGEPTIESLTYALDTGSGSAASLNCCRYSSDNGCDTQTPCDAPSNSCSSSSGSGCSSGSGSGCSSGSSSGSGCSSGSGSGCSSGSGSGCSSGSSGSGCSSGSSGSGCSSGSSGSGCSSGSGSGSSCGGSSCGSSNKCSVIPTRPVGDIPDPVTFMFLLTPLAFVMLEGRRRGRL
ncbi:MAG: hypothetical protein U1A78_35730 [Polyangia bacterium]